jgi:hypothetical protein
MKSRTVVIGLLALSLAFDVTSLAQTPSVSTVKPISEYMRNVGLLYIETVEGARSTEQLQTLRALEDRIDIQTVPQADKNFYERGLKGLRHLAEVRLADAEVRLADLQSALTQALKSISNNNRDFENIQESMSAEERQYSEGRGITRKEYQDYLKHALVLLQEGKSEAAAASEKVSRIKAELIIEAARASSPYYELNRPYLACDGSLRRMIKAGEYNLGELENDCKIPDVASQQQASPPPTQAPPPCPSGMTRKITSFGSYCEVSPAAPTKQAQAQVAPPAQTEEQRVEIAPAVQMKQQAGNEQQASNEYGFIGASSDGDPKLRHDGITLSRVAENGPAHQAGIRIGDVILAIDGHYVFTAEQLANELRHHSPGTTILIHYRRRSLSYAIPVMVSQKSAPEEF